MRVTVVTDYDPWVHIVELGHDDEWCDNMECIQEVPVPNACRMACHGNKHKTSTEKGLV